MRYKASMQSSGQGTPVLRDIVLVGGGHSHVGVLRSFAMRPMPGVRLTLICRDTHTPYSGMLPGYIAGHYGYDDVHIDLCRLAEFAGARLYRDEAIGIDRVNARVLCKNRPSVPYDRLSINIGSSPQMAQVPGAAEHVLPVKPIFAFNQRWLALLDRVRTQVGRTRIAVVGGGAGGVELLLAMQHRLRQELRQLGRDPDALEFSLFEHDASILPTHNASVRRSFTQVLQGRGVTVYCKSEVTQVSEGGLRTADGTQRQADEIIWVTRAGGAPWLRQTGLALDADGFIQVNDALQSLSDPNIFAAGDIASMLNHPLQRAGVFAVRQGKPLTENLRRAVQGKPLLAYRPQRRWLALISTGDRYAVASRGPLHAQGAWIWQWKNWIDRHFMRRFSEFPTMDAGAMQVAARMAHGGLAQNLPGNLPLQGEEARQALAAMAMRCGGCGAKVGASVLSRTLAALHPLQREDVLIGLRSGDDAAVLRVPKGKALVHSVDFFRSFISDPYVFGKVAANHALGDIFAMGAQAQSASAIVTLPPGLDSKLEDQLFQMMSGAVEVLNQACCALVGGHSAEGAELALGFAVNGLIDENMAGLLRKGGMRAGDALILTKPIGTGTLFAALARLQGKGRWIDAALASMLLSNRQAAQCLQGHGARACTDVTGFGLLGHLLEMTEPSGVHAEIDMAALPLLEGAAEMAAAGIFSSLQAANVRSRHALRHPEEMLKHPAYPLLFDPQTAGGLLASLPPERARDCVAALRALGYAQCAVIGRVLALDEGLESIALKA